MIGTRVAVDAFGMTDPGKQRDHNEDHFLIADRQKSIVIDQTSLSKPENARLVSGSQGKLLVVADGMGGHGGGEIASSVAVGALLSYILNFMPGFYGLYEAHEDELRKELKAAIQRTHASVRAAAKADGEHPRMGTTLTMAYVTWPRLYVVHVGDSRCYRFRDPDLEQVTTDHTLAEQMTRGELVPREETSSSRWSNVLWNAIGGTDDEPAPEVYKSELEPGDVLVLCTDGLTNHVSDKELRRDLREKPESTEAIARQWVDRANENGGSDNITVIVARFR